MRITFVNVTNAKRASLNASDALLASVGTLSG